MSEPIKRRIVYYIPGFDPKGAPRYRALYRFEIRRWTQMFGGSAKLSAAKREGLETRWRVDAALSPDPNGLALSGDGAVTTEYVVLEWDDLVRARLSAPTPLRILRGTGTFLVFMLDGALPRMLSLAWIPVVVTLYPFLTAALYMLLFLALTIGVTLGLSAALGASQGATALLMAPIGLAVGWGICRFAVWFEDRSMALYLTDLTSYCSKIAGNRAPELDQRIDAFIDIIAAAAKDQRYDEVLVVGHSTGCHLATTTMARMLARHKDIGRQPSGDGAANPQLGLLTLGQFMSAQMQMRPGVTLRAEYASVARSDRLTWVDISAHADAVCYGLCDPLADFSRTLPSAERRAGPKTISAAFKKTMAPESFEAIKNKHFRRHFQYLYVFERPGAFDYFRITAGPQSLHDRYAGVKSNARTPPIAAELRAADAPSTAEIAA